MTDDRDVSESMSGTASNLYSLANSTDIECKVEARSLIYFEANAIALYLAETLFSHDEGIIPGGEKWNGVVTRLTTRDGAFVPSTNVAHCNRSTRNCISPAVEHSAS